MQQIPCAGIKMKRAVGFSERPDGTLQLFRKRAAKYFLARTESRKTDAIHGPAPGILIVGDRRENLIEQRLRLELSRLARHVRRTTNAQISAAYNNGGQRFAGHADEKSGIALIDQRQRGEGGADR